MNVRPIKLKSGPCDGAVSYASHETAFMNGECYVWDGDASGNSFVHAQTALAALPADQFKEERERVNGWMTRRVGSGVRDGDGNELTMPAPTAELFGIPPWRINAWVQLIQTGHYKTTRES